MRHRVGRWPPSYCARSCSARRKRAPRWLWARSGSTQPGTHVRSSRLSALQSEWRRKRQRRPQREWFRRPSDISACRTDGAAHRRRRASIAPASCSMSSRNTARAFHAHRANKRPRASGCVPSGRRFGREISSCSRSRGDASATSRFTPAAGESSTPRAADGGCATTRWTRSAENGMRDTSLPPGASRLAGHHS
jgi:hypothetical protein